MVFFLPLSPASTIKKDNHWTGASMRSSCNNIQPKVARGSFLINNVLVKLSSVGNARCPFCRSFRTLRKRRRHKEKNENGESKQAAETMPWNITDARRYRSPCRRSEAAG